MLYRRSPQIFDEQLSPRGDAERLTIHTNCNSDCIIIHTIL